MYLSFNNYINQKFSYIFDLNYDTIKKFAIPTFIIFICYLLLYLIIEKEKIYKFKCCEKSKCYNSNIYILKLIKTIFWFLKSLFYYFLWYHLERGDIGKYEDFLKCQFVNKKFFDKNFPDIDKLRKFYIALIIINLIADMLDKFDTVLKSSDEECVEKKEDKPINGPEESEKSIKENEIKEF